MKTYSIEELGKYNSDNVNDNYVCHVTTKEQHDRLKQYFERITDWDKSSNYYLLSWCGNYNQPYYKTIEFEQINFPDMTIQERFSEFKKDILTKVDQFEQILKQPTAEENNSVDNNDFKDGEWLYLNKSNIVRIQRYNQNEFYQLRNGEFDEGYNPVWGSVDRVEIHQGNYTKATKEQIEFVLTKVAKWKGFKPGVKVNRSKFEDPINNTITIKDYNHTNNILYFSRPELIEYNGLIIYKQGIWAEIIKEDDQVIVDGYRAEYCVGQLASKYILFGPSTCKDSIRLTLEELKAIKTVMNLNKQFKYPFTIGETSINVLTQVNKNLSKEQLNILINKLEK